MTKQEISDLFDKYEDGYQAWRGDGVMTKGAFIEAVTEALRIHDVVGRSEQLLCPNCKSQNVYEFTYTDGIGCNSCGHQWAK